MAPEVRQRGHLPYAITNGKCAKVELIAELFQVIGASLDTVDAEETERIGRYKLDRMLQNFDRMVEVMGPQRIVIHTVDFGQSLAPLRAYLKAGGLQRHILQPLQQKADYAHQYAGRPATQPSAGISACRYIDTNLCAISTSTA